MLQIDKLQNFNQTFIRQNQSLEFQKPEPSILTVGGDLDTISFNNTPTKPSVQETKGF